MLVTCGYCDIVELNSIAVKFFAMHCGVGIGKNKRKTDHLLRALTDQNAFAFLKCNIVYCKEPRYRI